MKRHLTFELKRVFIDYKYKEPKELMKRIGMKFKLIGEVVVGGKFTLYFEDGFMYETSPLDLGGYYKQVDYDENEIGATICTKDYGYEVEVVEGKITIPLVEQLKIKGF